MSTFPPVAELLPHGGRAILLDAVLEHSPEHVRVVARITSQHPYFEPGHGVPSWVGIEMMAQAIAAHAGLIGLRDGRGPRQGMLLGTRCHDSRVAWFEEGCLLEISAASNFGAAGGMAACDCRIECNGRLVAEATIIIVEGELP